MKKKPTAIDLFSGAGGLSEGLKQAGYRVVGAVEFDGLACGAYRLNHKRVKLWEKDIRRVTGTEILKALHLERGQLDLLAACPPCQGFSSMRTKNGSRKNKDERNDLIFDVLRIIRSMRPKAVMLENVPGLASSRRFKTFCDALQSMSYEISTDILNTVDYGVPQRRRRLVLLASQRVKPHFAPKIAKKKTVRKSISTICSPATSRDPLHNYVVSRSEKVTKLIRLIPTDGGSRKSLGKKRQLSCHRNLKGFWDVYGRMAWDKPSPTITGGCINPSKGRFLHPVENRAITLRETALLQTFPKSYRFPMHKGRYPVALLIGNALPPEFIRRHALALLEQVLADDGTSASR
jgi:DNA (cytosine-5)-methyltransferase 1